MIENKKTLCIFTHYFPEDYFPIYVQYYLNELNKHFDEVRLVTNDRNISKKPTILKSNISIQFVKNEGYDFGMFYKAFQEINPLNYRQIACINDSNIVFGELRFLFDWGKEQEIDFWGLVDSHEKPWFSNHENNYHIQSHFMVFNTNAIALLSNFFKQIDYHNIIKEKDPKKLRRRVINEWEIGLSQYLLKRNLICKTYIDSRQFGIIIGEVKSGNATHKHYAKLIGRGIPFIKKRLIMSRSFKSKLKYRSRWSRLIRIHGDENWEIDAMIDELKQIRNNRSNGLLIVFGKKMKSLFSKQSA